MNSEHGRLTVGRVDVKFHIAGDGTCGGKAGLRICLLCMGGRREREDQQNDARDLHEQLRRRARANGDPAVVPSAQPHAVGRFVALLDFHRFARLQIVILDKPEEPLVLIDDPCDRDTRADGAGEQRLRLLRLHDTFRIWNRIAVRVDLRMSEHVVHAFDEPIGHDMLEQLRLFVHFVPAQAHDLHEKQFHETMTPQDERGETSASARERDTGVRLVVHQARFGERFDHRCRRARGDAERGRELPHRQQTDFLPVGSDRPQVNRLQVVLNRARWQHPAQS